MSLTVGWAWMNVCQRTTDTFVDAWNEVTSDEHELAECLVIGEHERTSNVHWSVSKSLL